jgi:cAMP-dependent protein kinase regulator
VITQGENGDCLFIVKSGTLRCYKNILNEKNEKSQLDLLVYKQGDIFGELALMYNSPRAASVVALTSSICFTLD